MNVKTSVSFPKTLFDKANKHWREAGHTSLSGYLQHLVHVDLMEHERRQLLLAGIAGTIGEKPREYTASSAQSSGQKD
jgi:hypothetical protein